MYVKTFRIYGYVNIESEIQSWLNRNPGIKILGISQSGVDVPESESKSKAYIVIIIYGH